ncbi:MAG: exosortase/archaeosortase family protein [Verrucomicrobiota bacterium]|nr:exosortase/archaeosortase family protein [Verrucomicrobiota bacterium]
MPKWLAEILSVVLPATLWLWLFRHLHDEWSLNAQYNYGWSVPFLAVFLFYLRWQTKPKSQPSRSAAPFVAWLILLTLLPIRVIEEANPDWRLLSWFFAFAVVAFSLLHLLRAGGKPWARHFAFPICFTLVGVPWLVQFENTIVHGLTRMVAYVAVETAGWLGIAAYQVGNIIQLANGFVGVDEACSGVKTLQASIMVSLFLGELLMLKRARRVALLVLGCVWVLACNVVRATTLMIIAARSGIPALEHWHDAVGTAVLVIGMVGLGAAALALSEGGETPAPQADLSARVHLPNLSETIVALVWIAAVFASSELWYRAHERYFIPNVAWQAQWPRDENATPAPIAEATTAILRYDQASSASWKAANGAVWWGFFARWYPGRTALQLVRSHSPEICLPAAGRIFRGELPSVTFADADLHLSFRAYEFLQQDQPLFVFVCIQEDKHVSGRRDLGETTWNARGRIAAAMNGQRNLGQRLLELAVIGPADAQTAREVLLAQAREIVRPSATR